MRVIFEQVLVALVLAFIFRAFVLEAFVIPTGSMAPTLLGAHMRFTCPDCGWRFEVNYPTDPTTQRIPAYASRVYALRCPNCAYRFPRVNEQDLENDATNPAIAYGDRILVLKHAYLLADPDRWQVVVFKNPSRSGEEYRQLPDWSTEPYQQNYIKRLIGLPGESIMLVDGDVYVNSDRHRPPSDLRPEDFQIARKTEVAQSALWRIIYDDDHRPQGVARSYTSSLGNPLADPEWQMPWRQSAGAGWSVVSAGQGGGFAFDSPEGSGTLFFDAQANPHTFAFTDYLAYDINASDQRSGREQIVTDTFDRDFGNLVYPNGPLWLNPVADLRLRLFYEKQSGEGPLVLRLTKRGATFEAEIRDGSVRFTGAGPDGTVLFDREALTGISFAKPRCIEFINADYRVRLRIDGRTILETTDDEYAPQVAALVQAEEDESRRSRPEVSISAQDQVSRLHHVSLWRDVHYTARDQYGRFNPYASPASFPRDIVRLGEAEYFTLGDNPFLSGDARGWTDGMNLPYEGNLWVSGGRVPQRFMLGRAFFVYWPAGFRPAPGLPAIVPNFGDMRFIR